MNINYIGKIYEMEKNPICYKKLANLRYSLYNFEFPTELLSGAGYASKKFMK